MLRGLFFFRGFCVVAFDVGLPGLAALGRSAFSTLVIVPNTVFRPIEAFVGDVDLLAAVATMDACLLEAGLFDASSSIVRDSGVLFTMEPREGRAFRLGLLDGAALPVVAAFVPLPGTRC